MSERNDDDNSALVIDAYGVRVRAPGADLGEPPAETWTDARRQVKGHLLRLATGPTRLLAETIEAATRLVRGLGSLPAAIATRIARSHDAADQRESQRRDAIVLSEELALRRVEEILQRLKVKGIRAEILIREDGRPAIVIVAPSERELAASVAEDATAELTERSE